MEGGVILPNGDFIVRCRRIIGPCFFWHHLFGNSLPKLKENIGIEYSRVFLPQSHGGSIFHPEVAYSRNDPVALSLRPLS